MTFVRARELGTRGTIFSFERESWERGGGLPGGQAGRLSYVFRGDTLSSYWQKASGRQLGDNVVVAGSGAVGKSPR